MKILTRMIGAARLDSHTYGEVKQDSGAMLPALLVVVAVAIFSGVGRMLDAYDDNIEAFVFAVVRSLVTWALLVLLARIFGSTILRTPQTKASLGQIARSTGFAQTPGLLNVFAFVPQVGGPILTLVFLWQLACMVIAIRQSLDYTSSMRAVLVVLFSLIVVVILIVALFVMLLVTGNVKFQ